MNLVYESNVDILSESDEYLKVESESYSQYLQSKIEEIPDIWIPREKDYESEFIPSFNFKKMPPKLKNMCKIFIYEAIKIRRVDEKTAANELWSINTFFRDAESPETMDLHNTDYLLLWNNYVKELLVRVKNKIYKNENTVKLEAKSAGQYALAVLKFFRFLSELSDNLDWASAVEIQSLFPESLKEYFSTVELLKFRSEFRALINQNKTKVIPYDILNEIMKFLYAQPPSRAKTAMIIAAHTGLRISEIRELTIDCIVPVTKAEIKTASSYIQKMRDAIVMKPDYAESYWVTGHRVIKGSKGTYREGAPILVGKQVKTAIDELVELTEKARAKKDSRHLFLVNRSGNVASYAMFLVERNKFVKEGMPFIRFHQFRSTFATILYDLKVPVGMIEKYLNHVSSDVTAWYISSEKERRSDLMNSVLSGSIVGNQDDEYSNFEREFKSIAISSEFAGMSFSTQLALFDKLMNQHDIKMDYSDHGYCVLPKDEICIHGYDDVSPCHASGCSKFKPDIEERGFFVELLDTRQTQKESIEEFSKQYGAVDVNLERFDRDVNNIQNIIEMIDERMLNA